MSDYISRADAIRVISEEYHNRGGNFDGLDAIRELETLPSKGGDAEILNEDFRPKYMQQCPNNGADLISRADAIEAVAQQWLFEASVGNPYVNDDDIGEYRKLAEELFEDVPSADAVQGEWIEQTDCEGKTRTITCSKCGWVEHSWVDLNFCPNCGARMKGGAE